MRPSQTPPAAARGPFDGARRAAWSDFLEGRLEVASRPFKASIEITRNCNFKCNMCPQSWSPQYREYHPELNMSPALFERLTREVFPRLEYAHLQGFGETTVSPHWPRILELCRPFAGKLRFGLVTNLSRAGASTWRQMADLGFHVIFSCDGVTRGTFETIRRGGRFEAILENLETLRRARRESGKGELELLVTLQGLNYREMPDFVDFAERYGASRITFASVMGTLPASRKLLSPALWRRLTAARAVSQARDLWRRAIAGKAPAAPFGNTAVGLHDCPAGELARLKAETLRRSAARGIAVRFNDAYLTDMGEAFARRPAPPPPADFERGIEESVKVSLYQRCFKPYSYVVINYRGDVGLCNHLITDSGWEQMGSLAVSSFDEIWNSEAYREKRRRLISAQPDNPSCQWCFKHRMTD
ncbi:MAG: radical SAM protein [Elusimicrobia bacterium]|nr:radical SAM protein [Elusimicrobiota bacterium]